MNKIKRGKKQAVRNSQENSNQLNYSLKKKITGQLNYPKVDRDLLMFAASFNRSPSAPDDFCLQKVRHGINKRTCQIASS